MQQPLLDQRLRLEGWTLHQRMRTAKPAQGGSQELEAWRTVVAPERQANFAKRLEWDGLIPEQAAWVLNPEVPAELDLPPWWPTFEQLRMAAQRAPRRGPLDQRGTVLPFVHAWRPAATWALETLQQRCRDLAPDLVLQQGAWLDLAEALLDRYCNIAEHALWELFNQRRTPGQMLLSHLGVNDDGNGEPVHEAYDAFVAELLASGYGLVLEPYPVLARLLALVTDLWMEGSEEMLRRVAKSRPAFVVPFAIGIEAPLAGIQQGLSDPHRGGRAVAILRFGEEGSMRRMVYKPKDMQVDHVYQEFLQRLNQASNLPPLRQLVVLSYPGYGFMEWVAHQPCESEDQLAAFYTNAGRMMAVLHVLGCTDCHHENLIASKDQLVLIDTETLLEADLRDLISDNANDPDATSPLLSSIQGSVLRSGLLPQWLMAGAGRKRAFDVSALGIQPPPPEREQPGWLALNSDGMMAGRTKQPCDLPTSLPVGLGSTQRLSDFVDELCTGFEIQLQELIGLKPLLQLGLDEFCGKPRRLVARNTRLYFTIHQQMLQPGALRNAVVHGLKLEQLSRSFLLASEKPINWRMFEAEVRQMEQLDIPFFEHLIDCEELPLPDGLAPIEGFMKRSGLAAAKIRLDDLDDAEISFQLSLIRGAISARYMAINPNASSKSISTKPQPSTSSTADSPARLDSDAYGLEASKLARQLWDASILDRNGLPEWLGMDLGADGESFRFGLIGHSLYSGTAGIAVALARIGLAQPAESADHWRDKAWCAMARLADIARRNSNDQLFRLIRDLPFGLSGTGGLLIGLDLMGQMGFSEAGGLVHQLIDQLRAERLKADVVLDVIGGVTGLIGPLLRSKHPRAAELALICGDRLIEQQHESGGWSIASSKPPFTGFSHGAAGMAASLACLSQATGEGRFEEAAWRAIAYERSVYVEERLNWPDFRKTNKPANFVVSWCHGSPGILLSRLVLRFCGVCDDALLTELEVCRLSTLKSLERLHYLGSAQTAHLCCGAFGLTALLRLDASLSGHPVPITVVEAERHLMEGAHARGEYSFFDMAEGSLNMPGLFTGKAGVALALQEVADGMQWLAPILSAGLLPTPRA